MSRPTVSPPSDLRGTLKDMVVGMVLVGFVACTAGTLASLGRSWWWLLDLASHFAPLYALGALVTLLMMLADRRWITAGVAFVVLAFNGLRLTSFYGTKPPTDASAPRLKVASFNMLGDNADSKASLVALAKRDFDILFLFEVRTSVTDLIEPTFAGATVLAEGKTDNFGVAVVSRVEAELELVHFDGLEELPAIAVHTDFGGPTTILGIHTMPPMGSKNTRIRNAMLTAAGDWLQERPEGRVIVGDLNATPLSSAFEILEGRGLRSSHHGYGWQGTWPNWSPFRIPIDHLLHDRSFLTASRQIGPTLGSDHHLLEVSLVRTPK